MNNKLVVVFVLVVGCGMLVAAIALFDWGTGSAARAEDVRFVQEHEAGTDGVSAYSNEVGDKVDPVIPEVADRVREGHLIGKRPDGGKSGWGAMLDRMHEFDADGDGMLSDLEKMTMGEQLKNEWMETHDLDGDGEISAEEWEAWQAEQFMNSQWGHDMMVKFDDDSDGVLNPDEEAALRARLGEIESEKQANELAELDTDGDGEISEAEREVQREQQRQWWANATKAAVEDHDRDGDGELNIEESLSAWDAWIQRQSIADFIKRYDTDRNGSMGAEDYGRFIELYRDGNLAADVNRDGVVNLLDMTAYTDLVERAGD